MIVLAGIQGKVKDYEKEVEAIDNLIISLITPELYADKEGELIRNFDKNCIALTKHLNIQTPKTLPVREFLGAIKELKEYLKPAKKARINGYA